MQIESEHGFKRIADLFSRYIAGVQTEKEERELYAWRRKEGAGDVFERLCEQVRARMHHLPEQEWEAAFARFERRKRAYRLKRNIKRWGAVAAALALVCGGGYFLWDRGMQGKDGGMELLAVEEAGMEELGVAPLLSSGSGESWLLAEGGTWDYAMYDSIVTSRGSEGGAWKNDTLVMAVPECCEYHLVLEDGTEVWMNADSKITYPAHFGKESREVKVEGEVYLEVAKDKSRPFRVEAGGMKIEVLGTSFNVNAYGQLKVTLVEGAVRAEGEAGRWRLAPGQQLAVEGSGVKVKKVNVADYVAWKEGCYIFKGETLEEIAGTLKRWYGKDVVFLDEQARERLFTGILDKDVGVDVFMKQLAETSGLKFVVSDNQVFVK